jgi:hypothetical protein
LSVTSPPPGIICNVHETGFYYLYSKYRKGKDDN